MIVKTQDANIGFRPVSISIILQTEDEISAFYAAMNHSAIANPIRDILDLGVIRESIVSYLGKTPDYGKVFQDISKSITEWGK